MNQTIQDIISRRSVKKYTDQQVPLELVEEVVKAGMYAPSGMNRQSAKIIAVTNKEMRDRLSIASDLVHAGFIAPRRLLRPKRESRFLPNWVFLTNMSVSATASLVMPLPMP